MFFCRASSSRSCWMRIQHWWRAGSNVPRDLNCTNLPGMKLIVALARRGLFLARQSCINLALWAWCLANLVHILCVDHRLTPWSFLNFFCSCPNSCIDFYQSQCLNAFNFILWLLIFFFVILLEDCYCVNRCPYVCSQQLLIPMVLCTCFMNSHVNRRR